MTSTTTHTTAPLIPDAATMAPPIAPPIAHAMSGSLGSTISMLLLYPLERVRIEMQTQASTIGTVADDLVGLDQSDEHSCDVGSLSTNYRDADLTKNEGTKSTDKSECEHDEDKDDNADNFAPKGKRGHSRQDSGSPSPSNSGSSQSSFSYELISQSKSLSPKRIPLKHPKKSSLLATLYHLHIQKSLYKGSTPIALTLALSNFIFFYTLQATKKIFRQKSASFLTSSVAGIVNVLLTNPFWVANLRIVNADRDGEEYRGTFHCLREIIRKEGLQSLWSGTWASLMLVSNPAIQYYTYENIKSDILRKRPRGVSAGAHTLKPMEAFWIGAVAKTLATVVTYPLQLAQVLMRLQKKGDESCGVEDNGNEDSTSLSRGGSRCGEKLYDGTIDCMLTLYRRGGIRALYSGMDAKLLQSVLTSALTFLTYEQILDFAVKFCWLVSKRLESNASAL